MKRILIPVDFSEDAVFAVDVGVQIANALKAKLRLMHVRTGKKYHPEFAKDNPHFIIDDKDTAYMEYLVDRARVTYKVENGEVDAKFREGNVVREIKNQAHYDDSVIIVIGTHGVSGFEDRWIGSNAYRLVSNAPCPVLAVRKQMSFNLDQKILLPIDAEKVSRRIVPQVAGFAKVLDAKVLVVGVTKRAKWAIPGRINAYVRQVERFLKKAAFIPFDSAIVDGSEGPQELLDYAHANGATVIALPVKKTLNPFESVFFPFANELLNMSDLPILAVPEHE
jgi:nucleotide-binding universal stress UspA family protein